jgi:hypothetical protein
VGLPTRRDTDRSGPPTALSALKIDHIVNAFCRNCDDSAKVDLAHIVARGLGAVPLIELKFRRTACGSRAVVPKVNSAAAGRVFVAPRKDGL